MSFALLGGLFFGLVILVWWAFFSRANRAERWGAIVLMVVAMVVTRLLLHESMARFPAIAGKTWNHPVLVG